MTTETEAKLGSMPMDREATFEDHGEAKRPTSSVGQTVTLRVFRGTAEEGSESDYEVPTFPGMVVLDAIHYIQAEFDSTLSCRWNCKAGKCGSCSAEINGKPRLLCKARVRDYADGDAPILVHPLKAFPLVKDLVTDVSWNYRMSERIAPFTPRAGAPTPFNMQQIDVDRIQEFRKCIECFLCQDTCHILRDHNRKDAFFGPRQLIKLANLDMHPYDGLERRQMAREEAGVGFCNITKCCSEVCPEHINLTDNGIIPLKERVADIYFDPVMWAARKVSRSKDQRVPSVGYKAPTVSSTAPPAEPEAPPRPYGPPGVSKDGIIFDPQNPYRARAIPRAIYTDGAGIEASSGADGGEKTG
jgi:succinate dehydrogenase / fumarate reductase iron-sulfur subunit